MLPNFEPTTASYQYIGLFFLENEETTLEIDAELEIAIVTHLKAWSTVLGGSLAAAPNELKKGLYSFGAIPSPYLRFFYPLFNG